MFTQRTQGTPRPSRKLASLAVVAAAGLVLTACSGATPARRATGRRP